MEALDLDVIQAAAQQVYKSSLYATAKHLCGYKDINLRTHGDLINLLESPCTRKLGVMPRGTFKTSLAVVAYAIWQVIKNPNIRIMLDSELWNLSSKSLREIKEHISGRNFQEVFPGWGFTLNNQDEIIINQRTLAKKEPTITASGIGAGKTGQHYDLIIADDLNSPKNSLNPELAMKVVDHYKYYTSILDPGGLLVVTGTRYSELDLIGHILANEMEE